MRGVTTRRSGWPAVLAYCLVGAANQMVWLTYAPVTTVSAEHFGVSETAVGWLANLFPLVYLPLAIPAGLALDRWFRPTLLLGAGLTAVGALVRLVDSTFAWALLGQVVVAVAQPFVLNAVTGITGHYLEEEDRAKGIALGTASVFAGLVLAFVLGAVLPGEDQLTTLVLIGSAFAVVAALLLAVALARVRPVGRPTASVRVEWSQVRVTLSDPVLRRLVVLVALPFGTFVALSTWAQALLEPAGVSADAASVMLLLTVVLGVAGCAVVPVIAAQRQAEVPAMTAALVLSGLACVALALVPGVGVGFAAFALIGLAPAAHDADRPRDRGAPRGCGRRDGRRPGLAQRQPRRARGRGGRRAAARRPCGRLPALRARVARGCPVGAPAQAALRRAARTRPVRSTRVTTATGSFSSSGSRGS